jgi:hypothetical protein
MYYYYFTTAYSYCTLVLLTPALLLLYYTETMGSDSPYLWLFFPWTCGNPINMWTECFVHGYNV